MNNREFQLKYIANEFAKWQVKIENLNSLNLYDTNLFSERSICDILNTIFDYKLKNINDKIVNYPAIDLVDDENRICVQVTSTSKKNKIQETLIKFFDKKLEEKYDEIFVLILGEKQKSYSALKIKEGFSFDPERHVFDFNSLLKFINALPTKRIEAISKLLLEEDIPHIKKQTISNSTKIKRNLALKKRLKKDLLRTLDREYWERAAYEPWIRFKYGQAIFRSVDDKCWPNADVKPEGPMSSWLKCDFWDFYDNGIELLGMGALAIFDKNGYWDILGWKDEREMNELYKKVACSPFFRIPYDYIVEYDMETDPYHGLPTIYVEYANNGMPYEEILYGIRGQYEENNFNKSRGTYYFDSNMRRKLE